MGDFAGKSPKDNDEDTFAYINKEARAGKARPDGQRHYSGYEDYSAEGRARINAFNDAKGSYYLKDKDPKKPYLDAVKKGDEAADEVKRERRGK